MASRTTVAGALLLVLCFLSATPALAHAGIPRLEIGADRLNPGGTLVVRGVDFEPEASVALTLIGPDRELSLGQATTDWLGVFTQAISLPIDLPENTYHIRAVSTDHDVTSPPLALRGSAVLTAPDDGGRDQGESLLAPLPTNSSAAQQLVPHERPVITPPRSGSLVVPLAAGVLVLIAVFTLVAWGLKPRH